MNPSRENQLFELALKTSVAQRGTFLDAVCGDDLQLRTRLEAMLAEAEGTGEKVTEPTIAELAQTVLVPSGSDQAPGVQIGRYKLLEILGEGGFGTVWAAEQKVPVRRRVALKIIKPGMDTKEVVARFEAERQALAMMDHLNIAKVFDAGSTKNGRPYFVMELVKGVPITQFCDQNSSSTRERIELFIRVCHALQHAHQKGIIHRDIKPSNIMVTLHDGVPVPKVIDFGIAKATQQELTEKTIYTQYSQFIGTPAYMSPEQAEYSGLDIDTRSDIYSLGVLLYELLTGVTPFDSKELMRSGLDQMRKIILEREPVRPSSKVGQTLAMGGAATVQASGVKAEELSKSTLKVQRELKGDLDWVVMKCLEKDRTRRYDTANALASDLKRHLDDEPVSACPPSTSYRLQKAVRRNKLAFASATAVVIALVTGLGLAALGLRNARFERNVALIARAEERVQRHKAQKAHANEEKLRQQAEVQELAARRRGYASDINLANHSIELNNFGRAENLINRHRPTSDSDIDLRGWEWRYLWKLCQSDSLSTLCEQAHSVFSVSTSRDGRWLAVGEFQDGGLSILDLRSREEIARIKSGNGTVRVAFSPSEPLLAYTESNPGGSDGNSFAVHLWDGNSKRKVATLPLSNHCLSITFAEDGRRLATIEREPSAPNAVIKVWSLPDGKVLSTTVAENMSRMLGQARFTTTIDLNLAAYALTDGRIRIVDLSTGDERWSAKAAEEWAMTLTFSDDGKILASSSGFAESDIKLWDVETGQQISQLAGHHGWVQSLVIWPDGKTLASASADQTIRLWNISDPANPKSLGLLRGHNVEVWGLDLLPDGVTLVSGGKDGSVRLWDTTKLRREQSSITIPATLLDWTFSPDSQSLVTVDKSGQVAKWSGKQFGTLEALMVIEKFPLALSEFVRLSLDGRRLATGTDHGVIQVWDTAGSKPPQMLTSDRTGSSIKPMAFLPRNNRLISAFEDGELHAWDLTTNELVESWQFPDNQISLAVSPSERWSAFFGFAGAFELRNGKATVQAGAESGLRQVVKASFSADEKHLAAVSLLGIGKVWSTESWQEVGTLHGFLQSAQSVVFSPDGKRIAAGSGGKEAIKFWDMASFEELIALESEGSNFGSVQFSPNGNLVGSMNRAGTLHLWQAPSWQEIEAKESKADTN